MTALVVISIVSVVSIAIVVRERSKAESRRERERQEEASARFRAEAAHADHKGPAIEGLYGHDVATMGVAFHGVTLGADARGLDARATAERIGLAIEGVVRIHAMNGAIADVGVYLERDRCHPLRDALARAWGEPSVDHTWLAPASHRRASYSEGKADLGSAGCGLTFDRYVDASEWVAALPIDGKLSSLQASSDDRVVEQVGENCYVSTWSGEGLGATNELTDYAVYMVAHKVVWIDVKARNATGFDEVRTKLVARLGTEPEVETGSNSGEVLRWERPVRVTAQHLDGDFDVMIGTYPCH